MLLEFEELKQALTELRPEIDNLKEAINYDAKKAELQELEERAQERGANAVVGVDIDYDILGADNGMLMVTVSGTAVVVG